MVAILGVFLVGCGALQVGTIESRRQRALRLITKMEQPRPVDGKPKEVVLVIISSPPNAEVYWSSDGVSFERFTSGGGLTPLSYKSGRWINDLWFKVRKPGFKESKTLKAPRNRNATLNFVLEAAHVHPPDADNVSRALFREYCAVCHGLDASGEGPVASILNPPPANLLDRAYVRELSDAHLFKVIKEGGSAADRSRLMPAWGDILSNQTISLLIHFIRRASETPHHPKGQHQAPGHHDRLSVNEGRKLFDTYCTTCHGVKGKGNGPLSFAMAAQGLDLTNTAYISSLSDSYLKRVISSGGPAVRRSPLMPPYKEWLNGQQISYLVAYMRYLAKAQAAPSGTPASSVVAVGKTNISAERGAKVFATHCVSCHGKHAKGDGPASIALTPKPANLTNTTYFAIQTNEYLRTVIQGGGAAVGKSPLMPPWKQTLKPAQVDDLVSFLRRISNTREPATAIAAGRLKPRGNVVAGAKVFQQFCVSCHGLHGRGDGPVGAALQPRPADLTATQYFRTVTDDYLRKLISGGGAAVGKSPLMPAWGNHLVEAQIDDLIAFLHKLSATSSAGNEPAPLTVSYRGSIDEGVRIYQHYCAACHGPQGKGDGAAIRGYTPRPADLTNTAYLRQLNDDYLRTVIAKGGAAVGKAGLMPPLGQALGDRGLNDVVAFIRKISGTQP